MATIITPNELPNMCPARYGRRATISAGMECWLRGYRYKGLDVIVPPVRDFTIVSYCRGATFMSGGPTARGPRRTARRAMFAADQVPAFALALDRGHRR